MIVIVDDSPDNGLVLTRLLRLAGYPALFLPCGKELFDYLQAGGKPKLLILDVMMPEMDGLQCLTIIRNNTEWRNIPVVMYSADATVERKKDAARMGARDYLVKGSTPWGDFLSKIKNHAEMSHACD